MSDQERAEFEAHLKAMPEWAPEFEIHRPWVEKLLQDCWQAARQSKPVGAAEALREARTYLPGDQEMIRKAFESFGMEMERRADPASAFILASLDLLAHHRAALASTGAPAGEAAPSSQPSAAIPGLRARLGEAHDASLDDDHRACRSILMECIRLLDAAPAATQPACGCDATCRDQRDGCRYTTQPAAEHLIAQIKLLPMVRASEIDGEESDGTPKHWRNRPYVSLTQIERLLRATQPAVPPVTVACGEMDDDDMDALVTLLGQHERDEIGHQGLCAAIVQRFAVLVAPSAPVGDGAATQPEGQEAIRRAVAALAHYAEYGHIDDDVVALIADLQYPIAARAAQPEGQEAALQKVRKAINDYHLALDTRQHGDVAAGRAVHEIEEALGMPWVQGAARAAQAQEGATPAATKDATPSQEGNHG